MRCLSVPSGNTLRTRLAEPVKPPLHVRVPRLSAQPTWAALCGKSVGLAPPPTMFSVNLSNATALQMQCSAY